MKPFIDWTKLCLQTTKVQIKFCICTSNTLIHTFELHTVRGMFIYRHKDYQNDNWFLTRIKSSVFLCVKIVNFLNEPFNTGALHNPLFQLPLVTLWPFQCNFNRFWCIEKWLYTLYEHNIGDKLLFSVLVSRTSTSLLKGLNHTPFTPLCGLNCVHSTI